MPPDRGTPGSPMDWMARARSDLALARAPLPEGAVYEDLCFHAQQAAEKAIKAVYRSRGWEFRYTHDLADLVNGLVVLGLIVPAAIIEAVELTEYASEARYPRTGEATTEEERHRAVDLAQAVVTWAAGTTAGGADPSQT